MFKAFRILTILSLFASPGICQGELEDVFAFVYDPSSSGNFSTEEVKAPIHIQEVFENLVVAKGDKSMPTPRLVVSTTERIAAWAQPSAQLIGIEQKALDICRAQGKDSLDAVAGLLAHELIHYYHNHDWKNHFIRNYMEAIELRSPNIDRGREMEIEADEMGGLLAHMAGYESLSTIPDLLDHIYKSYNLSQTEDNEYPSLKSRKTIAEVGAKNLQRMIPLYDMANYFIAIGAHDEAILYLNHILNKTSFRSREIYNNLGMLHAILAYEKRPNVNDHFRYGFHLDKNSRLATRGIADEGFETLCKKSINYLDQATSLDKNYAPAYINIANVYTMLGEIEDARYMIHKAKKIGSIDEGSIALIKGNIAARESDIETAKEQWTKASDLGNEIAKANLATLSGNDSVEKKSTEKANISIDGMNLDKLYAMILRDE